MKETSALPAVCGRVCPQEKQCEGQCIHLKMKKEAVAVGHLEVRRGNTVPFYHFRDVRSVPGGILLNLYVVVFVVLPVLRVTDVFDLVAGDGVVKVALVVNGGAD